VFQDPLELARDAERLEGIEKGTVRLVAQALYLFRKEAAEIFENADDLAGDIGEDITREALDRIGVSKIDQRLHGKIDYKRARYVFNRDYAVRQSMFVDSKAEKAGGTATIQTSQTSMRIRHVRAKKDVDEPGTLPTTLTLKEGPSLTTTVFVKFHYDHAGGKNKLIEIIIAGIPNGMLQDRYNPTATDSIWQAGRNAPSRGEEFRVRLSFKKLKAKTKWRVQTIPVKGVFAWDE
jgi:hypothetical protein